MFLYYYISWRALAELTLLLLLFRNMHTRLIGIAARELSKVKVIYCEHLKIVDIPIGETSLSFFSVCVCVCIGCM